MAFDKEFVVSQLEGVEKAAEIADKIMSEYSASVIGLTRNRDSLKAEKEKLAEEKKTLTEKLAELETANADLNGKLESGLGDKEKLLQADIEKWKSAATKAAEDLKNQTSEKDQIIEAMKSEHHEYLVRSEFRKKLDKIPGVFPEVREDLEKAFFADYPVNTLEFVDYAGSKEYRNKDSKTMDDLLMDKLNSPAGKRYRENLNNGGGAPGSAGRVPSGANPWVTGNRTEQMRLENENPSMAASLKASAGKK